MRTIRTVAALSLACVPLLLIAKGPTLKITMKGSELRSPVEISDERILGKFQVWAGAGTTNSGVPGTDGFIVDWEKGLVAEQVSLTLPRYEVTFHVMHQGEQSSRYVVYYAFDPATGKGYVYLPGKGEAYYESNTYLIWRGVEGHWLSASSAWTDVAKSTIERAKVVGQAAK